MNAGRRISLLQAGSMACFFLFVAPGTAMAAAICHMPWLVFGEPNLGPEGSYHRYGIFKTTQEAYSSVRQLAVDNMTVAAYSPRCPDVRIVPNDVPYDGTLDSPYWYALNSVRYLPKICSCYECWRQWNIYTHD